MAKRQTYTRRFLAVLFALLIIPGCANTPKEEDDLQLDWMNNPLGFVDRTVVVDTANTWRTGELERVSITDSGALNLNDPPGPRFPRTGTWTSAVYETDFPVTEVLPSWNVDAPKQTGVKFFVRTRDARSNDWSPWLYIGSWGKTLPAGKDKTRFKHGKVKIDYLKLMRPADAFQLRAVLESFDIHGQVDPTIRKLTTVYSGIVKDPERRAELTEPVTIVGNWARTLDVPFFAQGDAPEALRSRVCSPTSTTMLMRYRGGNEPYMDNVLGTYDPEHDIFGNWGRAVAYAGQLGFDAYLMRIRSWDQVKAYIAAGQPLIISIRFEPGTFPSNPMGSTDGHIVVIRGLTPQGDPVMNDGGRRSYGNGVVFKADELARAWIRHGGVAYIIGPRIQPPIIPDRSR